MWAGNARQTLLGLGVLLLTTLPSYMASRVTGQDESVGGAGTPSSVRIDDHIREVAVRYRVSEHLVAAIIEAESEFNPHAVSCRGARGLMQLMPATAATLGVGDPFDPLENIEAGVRHLRGLMEIFNDNLPLVVAAYNAGHRAVIAYRGIPPYPETREYVNRVLRRLNRARVTPSGTFGAGERPRATGSAGEAIVAAVARRAFFGAIPRLDRCPAFSRKPGHRMAASSTTADSKTMRSRARRSSESAASSQTSSPLR
jgi:hypothetical protein